MTDSIVQIPRGNFFDILSDALATQLYNFEHLSADGTVGKNIRKALLQFLADEDEDEDFVNLIIRLLKNGGYNPQLEADGQKGDELFYAINVLLEDNDLAPITQDEIDTFGQNDEGENESENEIENEVTAYQAEESSVDPIGDSDSPADSGGGDD